MSTEVVTPPKMTRYLLSLHEQQATGELVITHGRHASLQWRLFFSWGRLVYATGGVHPVRRWYRAFKYHAAEQFSIDWLIRAQAAAELWEVDLLNQALEQDEISTAQFKAIVQAIVYETMFAVVGQKFVHFQWNAGKRIPQQTVLLAISQTLREAHHLREQWRNLGLGFLQEFLYQFSPDLAPVLRRPYSNSVPDSTKSLLQLMRGQLTFWDIAMELQQSLPHILQSLAPLIRQGIVELREIADLPSPYPPIAATPLIPRKALIGCVDDNPLTISAINHLLRPHGYEVLGIFDPLEGLATLLAQKPDLILLDPIMPDTNGYEYCALLRKSPEFHNTPIVILTRQDSKVDRIRAKLAGASEFLVKPLEPAQVLHVVQQHLKESSEPYPNPTDWAVVQ
ncbi:response regulator [Phormidium tenue FACHB-886]|nr:response regulator [Phormidium tenue FACHB-886]